MLSRVWVLDQRLAVLSRSWKFIFSDFDRDIYGEYIHVDFVARLRDEEKFAGAQDLIKQMDIDSANARKSLATG